MARSHLCRTNHLRLGPSRPRRGAPLPNSAGLAHLRCMEPESTPTPGPDQDDVVVTGVFASALSLHELAAQLHVSAQTIYDLRSQGRGPIGFRVGRHLRFRTAEIEAWLARLEEEDGDRHPGVEMR